MKSSASFIIIGGLLVIIVLAGVLMPQYGLFDVLQNLQHSKKTVAVAEKAYEYDTSVTSTGSTDDSAKTTSSGVLVAPITTVTTPATCPSGQVGTPPNCTTPAVTPTGVGGNWSIILQEDFSNATLDSAKWITGHTTAKGTSTAPFNEATEDGLFSADNVAIKNGTAELTLKKQANGSYQYTSGMLQSTRAYQTGFIEARVSFSTDAGVVPAFWLQNNASGQANAPFIDIFRFDSTKMNKPILGVNWRSGQELKNYSSEYNQAVGAQQFHSYGLLWRAGVVQAYFDGVAGPVYSSANVPTDPSYITLSLAALKGSTAPNNAKMTVDYIRAWAP